MDQRRQSFLVHMYGISAADFDLYRALFPLRVTQTASPSEGHSERTRSPAAPPRSRAASARAPTCQTRTPASGPRDASGIPGRLPAQSSLRRLMVVREGVGRVERIRTKFGAVLFKHAMGRGQSPDHAKTNRIPRFGHFEHLRLLTPLQVALCAEGRERVPTGCQDCTCKGGVRCWE